MFWHTDVAKLSDFFSCVCRLLFRIHCAAFLCVARVFARVGLRVCDSECNIKLTESRVTMISAWNNMRARCARGSCPECTRTIHLITCVSRTACMYATRDLVTHLFSHTLYERMCHWILCVNDVILYTFAVHSMIMRVPRVVDDGWCEYYRVVCKVSSRRAFSRRKSMCART